MIKRLLLPLPQHCQLGLQTESSRCASLPLAGQPAPSTGSFVEFHVSSLMQETLQRIVGGEEGMATCQSAGKRKISEIRRNGVFHAATPLLAKHQIVPQRSQRSDGDIWSEVRREGNGCLRVQNTNVTAGPQWYIQRDGNQGLFQPG